MLFKKTKRKQLVYDCKALTLVAAWEVHFVVFFTEEIMFKQDK